MRARKAGKIVNVTSMAGKIYTPFGSWYHATRHALEGWSDSRRLELAPFGIDVIVIEPGLIDTEFGDVAAGPMLRRSGTGAYAALAERVAAGTRRTCSVGHRGRHRRGDHGPLPEDPVRRGKIRENAHLHAYVAG